MGVLSGAALALFIFAGMQKRGHRRGTRRRAGGIDSARDEPRRVCDLPPEALVD